MGTSTVRKFYFVIAGLLIAASLSAAMAVNSTTARAAASSNTNAHWVVVDYQTHPLPKALCDHVRAALGPVIAHAHPACDATSTLLILHEDGPIPNAQCGSCGGDGGCNAQSHSWQQFYAASVFGLAFYFQQTGTFSWDYCHTPTDSGHNCTRNMSYSPGVTVANTACSDYDSGGLAYAEGDYQVAMIGFGSTYSLVAHCDQNGNIYDPSVTAE